MLLISGTDHSCHIRWKESGGKEGDSLAKITQDDSTVAVCHHGVLEKQLLFFKFCIFQVVEDNGFRRETGK